MPNMVPINMIRITFCYNGYVPSFVPEAFSEIIKWYVDVDLIEHTMVFTSRFIWTQIY